MTNQIYPKGSEWRKWDLHVHTPYSYLNNGFGDDFDVYVKSLFQKAIKNNIVAIGITDYFCIEGYKKIKNEYINDLQKLQKLFTEDEIEKIKCIFVFPNIEFRLNKLVGQNRINFHVIISDNVEIKDIEENFLHEIDFLYEGNPGDEDEKRKLKIDNIKTLGKKLKSEHKEFESNSDIFVGMMNAVVNDEQISQILGNKNSIFKDKYLLVIPSDEDLSKVSWNGQDHLARKILIQKSHLLMVSNPKSIQRGLGQSTTDSKENFISEFKTLKPCIWGSDAHEYEKLFLPDENRFCRIKADPIFEGLKQIIYEPEDRVKILNYQPEHTKNPSEYISHIEVDNASIYNEHINFHPNLTAIIGGRSSGKSLLIGLIASKFGKNPKDDTYYNTFVKSLAQNIKVIRGNNEEISENQIEYFSQEHISRLSRLTDKGEFENDLRLKIDDILRKKKLLEHKENFHKFCSEQKITIENNISQYFNFKKELFLSEQELKNYGDITYTQTEIDDLEIKIKKLSTLDNQTRQGYEDIKKEIEIKENKKQILLRQQIAIEQLCIIDDIYIKELFGIDKIYTIKIEQVYRKINDYTKTEINKTLDELLNSIKKEINEIDSFMNSSKGNSIYLEGQKNDAQNIQIKELTKMLQLLKEKQQATENLKQKIESIKTQLAYKRNLIFSYYKEFNEKINECIGSMKSIQNGKLCITPYIRYNEKKLHNFLDGYINKRYSDGVYVLGKVGNITEQDSCITYIQDVFSQVEQDILKLNGYNENQIELFCKGLLGEYYFDIEFKLTYDNVEFLKMSEGKRAFVILKLLLDFSTLTCPIIIDQPEDNLDNRSISNELAKYLKSKKKDRQIIVVTHNANVVLGGDAELVIVANEHGENNKNTNSKKFEYLQGSIENTSTTTSDFQLHKMGIREHICDILEGGKEAFEQRKKRYNFK